MRRQKTLPPGVHLTMWGDYSFYVADRLGMLVDNGILGFILVFLTLWFMLNVRLSFWVAGGNPDLVPGHALGDGPASA